MNKNKIDSKKLMSYQRMLYFHKNSHNLNNQYNYNYIINLINLINRIKSKIKFQLYKMNKL